MHELCILKQLTTITDVKTTLVSFVACGFVSNIYLGLLCSCNYVSFSKLSIYEIDFSVNNCLILLDGVGTFRPINSTV